ncbi:hypothetical protein HCB37_16780 [Listeria booriae]|uniref:hypothetical protein n=1 Tax=Listeria booriae TaxID=1552123 RepID=UPI001624D167|nr:hypothetical protein [Listeria booriae]MBC2069334.1 hypothetical protein [Listeria booriae]MBC2266159.1 hypothetical protein [Listeria booriae]
MIKIIFLMIAIISYAGLYFATKNKKVFGMFGCLIVGYYLLEWLLKQFETLSEYDSKMTMIIGCLGLTMIFWVMTLLELYLEKQNKQQEKI